MRMTGKPREEPYFIVFFDVLLTCWVDFVSLPLIVRLLGRLC